MMKIPLAVEDGHIVTRRQTGPQRIVYFGPDEIGEVDKADPDTVLGMDMLRGAAGVPIYIHQIFDPKGHAPDSRHYVNSVRPYADACDFHFGPGLTYMQQLVLILSMVGWGGIGFYPHWNNPGWHVDRRPVGSDGQRLLWWRDARDVYHYGWSEIMNGVAVAQMW